MRAKKFLLTTLLGGVAALLPLGLIIILFRWIIVLIEKYLNPLVLLLKPESKISTIIIYAILVVGIILIFFLIGLFIRTRFGNWLARHIENVYLIKIPGYKTARDIVRQFFGRKRTTFSEVVFVDIYGNDALLTGFVTDTNGEYITVFVPTAPNPTSGFVFHVPRNKVYKSNTQFDVTVKSIISCGAGSSTIFANKMKEPYSVTNPWPEKDDNAGMQNKAEPDLI